MSNSISGNRTVLFGPEPNPGDNIGGYILLKKLGQGGMGHVWKVEHLATGTLYAMKLLPPVLASDPRAWNETLKNFQLVSKLNHQHICPLHVLDRDPKHGPYLVMALIDGVSLDEYRDSRSKFSAEEVSTLLRPVAEALDYAHSQGVIHRDVKHDNIVLQSPDGGKTITGTFVIDFGLAAQVRSSISNYSQQDVPLAGTIRYMAPETWRGRPPVPQSDQYSLAVIAYRLLASHYPFDCPDRSIMREAVLNETVEPIADLSKFTNEPVFRGLAKKPEDRFESCVGLISGIEKRQQPLETERPPILHSGTKAGERRAISFLRQEVPLRWCPPGRFMMGSPKSEQEEYEPRGVVITPVVTVLKWIMSPSEEDLRSDEEQAEVIFSHGFWMSETAVTQRQYEAVCRSNPSTFRGADAPVQNVTWHEAQLFCKELASILHADGVLSPEQSVRLPTEAEWEYACRSGTSTPYSFGNDRHRLKHYAWFMDNSNNKIFNVGGLHANPWGFHDMMGNVDEWCSDWYTKKLLGGTHPLGPSNGSFKVARGGSVCSLDFGCRSAHRSKYDPNRSNYYQGFRFCISSG